MKEPAVTYYVLCQCGNESDALMSNGEVQIFLQPKKPRTQPPPQCVS